MRNFDEGPLPWELTQACDERTVNFQKDATAIRRIRRLRTRKRMPPLSSVPDPQRPCPTESKSSRLGRRSRFLAPGTFSDTRRTDRSNRYEGLPRPLRRLPRDDDRPRFDRTGIRSAGNATDCHSIRRRAVAVSRGQHQSTGPWPVATRKPGSNGGASARPDAMRQRRRRLGLGIERVASSSGTV